MKSLRFFVFPALLLISFSLSAQCNGDRFLNMVFAQVEVTQAVPFGSNINFLGDPQSLLLDVYEPSGDEMEERPLLIMVHGGSFVYGARDEVDVVSLCYDFAKMGYVVASIDYRLGFTPTFENLEIPLANAVVRGVHDFRASVRFFRKTVAEDGNPYGIDPNRIMVAGISAGGFIALHHAYMDQESEIPGVLDQTLPGLGGGLEGNSGNSGYSSEVLGVVNIAGALRDTSWMDQGDEPVCNFHGTNDSTVPFGSDTLYFFNEYAITEVDGSESVAQKADEMGIPNCFEIYENAGHVPHISNALQYDTTRAVMSNFLASLVCDVELDCDYRELAVGVSEFAEKEPDFSINPNPATEKIRLNFQTIEPKGIIEVYSMQGKLMKKTTIDGDEQVLNISALPRGLYVLEVRTKDAVIRKKFIKK